MFAKHFHPGAALGYDGTAAMPGTITPVHADFGVPGYERLRGVLLDAFNQAAIGKGAVRHACGAPFHEQPMQVISELLNTPDGLRYQAIKKIQESCRMDRDAAIRELLGAINYIAGVVIYLEKKDALPPA